MNLEADRGSMLADLEHLGYSSLPRSLDLEADHADRLRAQFFEFYGDEGEGWHNSFNTLDFEYRNRAWDTIRDAVSEPLAHLLPGYEPFNYAYLCKWPGEESYLYAHQDWNYIDIRTGQRTYAVFIALEDIAEENGQVHLVPGSHRIDSMVRGTHIFFSWSEHLELLEERSVPVTLAKGEGAIWDTATVHYSAANLAPEPRLALGIGLAPIGAQLVHYRREDEDTAALYHVDLEFYRYGDPYSLEAGPPQDYPEVERVPIDTRHATSADLAIQLDRALGVPGIT